MCGKLWLHGPVRVMGIDDEGMAVAARRMAMRMRMGLRTFPAFVFMLVVFVVDVQMAVMLGRVFVFQHNRIAIRPEPCGRKGPGQGE